ncbi:MAG: diguanylate cyclase [Bacteroides sp.]|nr:diguanylate cyclase [Eubacterium sp.]MCM1418058.1 diguanylate cyclase [Roseburia sp.]MCM1462202.1 diguanylate cyclase [Bacteroides sp.]
MSRRVDISELYDELQQKREGYVLCYDVVGLDEVNKTLGRKTGDAAILEAFRRIDAAAGAEMIVFRIGGDEFAIVTGLTEKEAVEAEAEKVLSQNGKTILAEGRELPVSLRAGAIRLGAEKKHNIRYDELFGRLRYVTDHAQNLGKVDFCAE